MEKNKREKEELTKRRMTGVSFARSLKWEREKKGSGNMPLKWEGYRETVSPHPGSGVARARGRRDSYCSRLPTTTFCHNYCYSSPSFPHREDDIVSSRRENKKSKRIPLPLGSPGSTLRKKPQVSSLRVGGTE
ncbi:UNVERIFIED_CONTAM: hypothetical protein Slati_3895000 [Sesamum latifolium]|uniref:Uncharacterized protein n=1 Tax=Sesamum latifolium TaxID=2727402 RepID=A0AAW2TQG5_9LAMI